MSCVLTDSSVVVKEGKVWVVDGKYRVKKLTECQILGEEKEANEEAPEAEAPAPAPAPTLVSPPPALPTQPQGSTLVSSENQEFIELFKLVGGNAWLALVVVAYVLGKKYLEKMDLAQASQAKLKEEISKQATETNTKIEAVSSKLDNVVATKIDHNKTELMSHIKDNKTELSKELDAFKKDSSKELEALAKDTKASVDSLEKRLLAVELEVKYNSNKSTGARGKKSSSVEED
jgi:Skp family chaperone for outer membrane proteins